MKRISLLILTAFVIAFCVAVETSADEPRFEVASVKPAAGPHPGIRFKESPGRVNYSGVSLKELVTRAYRLKEYQLDAQGWLDSEFFDIDATNPQDAESAVPEMLQALLVERFQLRAHLVVRSVKGYALRARPNAAGVLKPVPEPGRGGVALTGDGVNANMATMESLGDGLSRVLAIPVVDETGLTGRYTFELKLHPEDSGPGQPAFSDASAIMASLKEIGLALVGTTVTDKYLIVDGAERVPSGN